MKALYLKTGEKAMVVDVSNTLREYQMLVDGPIESVTIWWDDLVLICNEEGRLREDIRPNRRIYLPKELDRCWNWSRTHLDIYGDCLIVGWGPEDFTDIPEEKILQYTELMDDRYNMWNYNEDGEWYLEKIPERAN